MIASSYDKRFLIALLVMMVFKNTAKTSRSEMEHRIDEFVFKERDRKILKRRLLDGICFEPLAEEFNLSVQQTKNIVYKSQNLIKR